MNRFLRAAWRGVRNELQAGESGWVNLGGSGTAWVAGGSTSKAGTVVTAESTMCISAAFDCTRKTSEMIGSLPLDKFRKGSDGSRDRVDDDLAEIIKESPNSEQTAMEFWEGMTAQMVLRGNACAEKLFIGNRLVGLRPLITALPKRSSAGGFEYEITDRGKKYTMPANKVFHLRGFGAGDGLGLSAIKYGTNSLGAAIAADETASGFFSNAAMPSGILKSDQVLNEGQRDELGTLLEKYASSKRAGKIMTLEAGLSYEQLQMNPEDAQLLETRRFAVEDVCRWFGVPPIVIGHSAEGQTMWGSGVEAILLSWLVMGINPMLTRIEKRIRKDLMAPADRKSGYVEFNREAMIQMDSKSKADMLMKMRFAGIMTGDEGRDKLNMPRRGGNSDELFIQSSMTPIDLLKLEEEAK